jgi:5-oxoprolinase (ATP-hydrolysing)
MWPATTTTFDYVFEHIVGDATLVAPALAIESVAAGGGSICAADARGLHVGPASAGAHPGPACYGANGPLTITDVNLLLGRLDPARFPIPVRIEAAEGTAARVVAALPPADAPGDHTPDRNTLLSGFLDIANERMADAIRAVSLRRGYDPADYALVAFGGAGGQHACAVAARLNMKTVLVPPDAGLLSAYGLGHAVVERFAERQVLAPLSEIAPGMNALLGELADEARAAVAREGIPENEVVVRRRIANLRLVGQDSALAIEIKDGVPLAEAFAVRYEAVFAHRPPASRAVEIESVRVVASSSAPEMNNEARPLRPGAVRSAH